VRKRYTTIPVSREVKERLDAVRERYRAGSWDGLLLLLLRELEECSRLRAEAEVRELMCNELSEARASLPAWGRLLTSRLRDPDLVSAALGYLAPDPQDPDTYVVKRERCAQQP
jgi:hypothetical protein